MNTMNECFCFSGTASLDPKSNGKISMVAILYVVSSNTVGVLVGLIMYFIVKPGNIQMNLFMKRQLKNRQNKYLNDKW